MVYDSVVDGGSSEDMRVLFLLVFKARVGENGRVCHTE